MTAKPTFILVAMAFLRAPSINAQTDAALAETLFQQGRARHRYAAGAEARVERASRVIGGEE